MAELISFGSLLLMALGAAWYIRADSDIKFAVKFAVTIAVCALIATLLDIHEDE